MMKKPAVALTIAAMVPVAAVALGARATFTPLGPTTVLPGTNVAFAVTVSVESLPGFDAADIAIGSGDATDIGFQYSASWRDAFANVTPDPPAADVGLYGQDVFVGGNDPNSVGQAMFLGIVTVVTTGMGEGTYDVRIDPTVRLDVSSVVLDRVHEGLQGSAAFTIECAAFDPECDIDVDLDDYVRLPGCLGGPEQGVSTTCARFDNDGDGDVDLIDMSEFFAQFTGPF